VDVDAGRGAHRQSSGDGPLCPSSNGAPYFSGYGNQQNLRAQLQLLYLAFDLSGTCPKALFCNWASAGGGPDQLVVDPQYGRDLAFSAFAKAASSPSNMAGSSGRFLAFTFDMPFSTTRARDSGYKKTRVFDSYYSAHTAAVRPIRPAASQFPSRAWRACADVSRTAPSVIAARKAPRSIDLIEQKP